MWNFVPLVVSVQRLNLTAGAMIFIGLRIQELSRDLQGWNGRWKKKKALKGHQNHFQELTGDFWDRLACVITSFWEGHGTSHPAVPVAQASALIQERIRIDELEIEQRRFGPCDVEETSVTKLKTSR